MSLFLLVLGAVTTVAGLVLVASGVILPEGTLSTEVVIPGTIAAVGGLLLVGIAIAVRQLQRIEQALAARPIPRPTLPNEAPLAFGAKSPAATVRLPFPPKPQPANAGPPPLPPAATSTSAPAEVAAFETPPAKFPAVAPIESAPVVEEAIALMPQTPVHAEEAIPEVKDGAVIGRGANGATPFRPVPRVVAKTRQPAAPNKAGGAAFNAFWPAKSRGSIQLASAEVAVSAPQPPPLLVSELSLVPAPINEAFPAAQPVIVQPAAAAPISILKSGVVEGMAYTLYSDGSIEAELPQGTLRFGSIAALRNHLESGA
ncbi:MAG: hypothetical protein ACLPX7_26540 [Xanthobacteraceae bacterium]